jgi:hypothetical protein
LGILSLQRPQERSGYQPKGNIDTSKLKPPQGGTGVVRMKGND